MHRQLPHLKLVVVGGGRPPLPRSTALTVNYHTTILATQNPRLTQPQYIQPPPPPPPPPTYTPPTRQGRSPVIPLVVLVGLTGLSYYAYQVYLHYGFPLEVLRHLAAAEHYTSVSERGGGDENVSSNGNGSSITNIALSSRLQALKAAESELRAVVRYLDQRLPPRDQSNISVMQRRTSSTNTSNNGSVKNSQDFSRALQDAPVVNKNYVAPSLQPHTLVKLAQNLQTQGSLFGSLSDDSKAQKAAQNQLYEAEALYLRAIQILSQQHGLYSPQAITPARQLGWLYADLGEYDRAEGVLIRCLEMIQHVRVHHDPNGQIPSATDAARKSTASSLRDFFSLSRALSAVGGDTSTPPAAIDYNDRLRGMFDAEVESEIAEQLGIVYRAQGNADQARQWTLMSLTLLSSRLPPVIQSYYTVVEANAIEQPSNAPPLTTPLSDAEIHRLRRVVDILSGLSSDLHFAGQSELASRAALAALNVIACTATLFNENKLPPQPSIDTVLPPIVPSSARTISTVNAVNSRGTNAAGPVPSSHHVQDDLPVTRSEEELNDYLDYITLSVLEAKTKGLTLSEEGVAALSNASTTLYSLGQHKAAQHALQLARQIADDARYAPQQLAEIEAAAKQWKS